MRDTLNHVLSTPLDVGWKVLTALTVIAMCDMTRQLFRRTGALQP